MENREIVEKLSRRFPVSEVKSREAAFGQRLDYVSQDQVIERLNSVLGSNWSVYYNVDIHNIEAEITKKEDGKKIKVREKHLHAIVKAAIQIRIDDNLITKEGYGAENLEKPGTDVDMAIKSAQSSALKKAAVQLGVGLYLYDIEERNYISEQRDELRNKASEEDRKKLAELSEFSLDKTNDLVIQYATATGKKVSTYKDLHSSNIKDFIAWVEAHKK